MTEIQERLYSLGEASYRDFQAKLIPNVAKESMLGVRTPALRSFARELYKSGAYRPFLETLPHAYFDENQLHAFLLSEFKDFDLCLEEVNRFLPYVDNWATCDQLSPRVFKRRREALLPQVLAWVRGEGTYTIRFGVGMLLAHYLEEAFDPGHLALVAALPSQEYYVGMMAAWYFATALAKQYEAALPYLTERRLDPWVHRKTIQKAVESYRIPEERKALLKTLR